MQDINQRHEMLLPKSKDDRISQQDKKLRRKEMIR